MKPNNHKELLNFITLPQCILAVFAALIFIQGRHFFNAPLLAVLIMHVIFNIYVVFYYLRVKNRDEDNTKALYAFLVGLMFIFSCGISSLHNSFSLLLPFSARTLYLLCNSVSLIYLSQAIIKKTSLEDKPNLTAIVMLCFALPVSVYILLQSSYTLGDVSIVLAIGLFCIFLFLMGKLIFILYLKCRKPQPVEGEAVEIAETGYSERYLIFVGITAVLLPQVGLFVNNSNVLFFGGNGGILGDFSSPLFYIIAAVNGLLLLIDTSKTKYVLPLFYLKSVGFAFIAYFTLVFIPFMPYAIIGIIIYGLGLLVYVPAVVFYVQIKQLIKDFKRLKSTHPKHIIVSTAAAGLLTLPTILAVDFYMDRSNFNAAMAYADANHAVKRDVNVHRLNRSLIHIEASTLNTRQMGRGFDLNIAAGTPLITSAYRYIALDNVYFTEDTLFKLRKIFMPEKVVRLSETMLTEPEPNLDFSTHLSIGEPEYDSASGTYKVWIDFELTELKGNWRSEYRTKFAIPDGCFITDYYLYVESEKKRGIITDKRAALVLYESIIRTPKDPGIIYYENDNTIALRVWPFSNNETRKSGFQLMYSQNETLEIEGITVKLQAPHPIAEPIHMDGVQFIPKEYMKMLPPMEREPLYYFLLDAGDAKAYRTNLETAKAYAADKNLAAKYYAVSYQAKETNDSSVNPPVKAKGGFNTAYAMDEIFRNVPDGHFPIMVLVTENINRAVPLEKTRLTATYPEVDNYYRLNYDFSLTPYRFSGSERLAETNALAISTVLSYNGIAVNGEKSETIIIDDNFAAFTNNPYKDAFILQKNTFLADTNTLQIPYIKESMRRRILTKHTAFMVMETKEQEDMLLKLQEQFLNGASYETPATMMSEPVWTAVIAVLVLILFLKNRRKLSHES